MVEFKNIPHADRFIYKRTFMNEITLLFTFSPLKMDDARVVINHCAQELGLEFFSEDENDSSGTVTIKDKDAKIIFTTNAVFVSLSTKEYKDFNTTGFIWEHLSNFLQELNVSPVFWSFTKGNRWIFNKVITPEMTNHVYSVVLSKNLLDSTDDKHFYVEESTDKSCVFTCRFGLEKIGDKDSIGLKTMIASQSYSIDNLAGQIFEVNSLMFDVWNWCVSDDVKKIMQLEK